MIHTLTAALLAAAVTAAPAELTADMRAEIDKFVEEVRSSSGAPSISIAVVKDGRLALARAYGDAKLEPKIAATPEHRYNIGSVSKQFTAAAVLFLVDDGKLSLDDKVSRHLPGVTRGGDVTLRQLLSHTSGYRDWWPQDYAFPAISKPTTPQQLVDGWTKQGLDFEPGAEWQYSNTGYVIAGMVVEKVSGQPLLDFLRQRAFKPLGMDSVADADTERPADPVRYTRFGLGPVRPTSAEGKGWLFAAGGLAMSASDLARWNIALLERRVFKPASHDEMERPVLLKNGASTDYGLGLRVHNNTDGKRVLAHGGAVMGFSTSNTLLLDEKVAVTVLSNLDASAGDGPDRIATQILKLLFAERSAAATHTARATSIVENLQHGRIEPAVFTANCRSYFTPAALKDFAAGLHPLGAPKAVRLTRERKRGGLITRVFEVEFAGRTLEILERSASDGKVESWIISPKL